MNAYQKTSVSNNHLLYSLEDRIIDLGDQFESEGVAMSAYCLTLNGKIRRDLQRVHPTIFNSLGGDEFPYILTDALFIAANHDPYMKYNTIVWADTVSVVQRWVDEIESNFNEIVRNAKRSRSESWNTSFGSVIHRS